MLVEASNDSSIWWMAIGFIGQVIGGSWAKPQGSARVVRLRAIPRIHISDEQLIYYPWPRGHVRNCSYSEFTWPLGRLASLRSQSAYLSYLLKLAVQRWIAHRWGRSVTMFRCAAPWKGNEEGDGKGAAATIGIILESGRSVPNNPRHAHLHRKRGNKYSVYTETEPGPPAPIPGTEGKGKGSDKFLATVQRFQFPKPFSPIQMDANGEHSHHRNPGKLRNYETTLLNEPAAVERIPV